MKFLGKHERCRTAEEPLLPESETRGVSGILPPEFSREVIQHYLDKEWAMTIEDVLLRRAGWGYYESEQRVEEMAEWMDEVMPIVS
jgi:glycerol-3-phosphate dehydrogenase